MHESKSSPDGKKVSTGIGRWKAVLQVTERVQSYPYRGITAADSKRGKNFEKMENMDCR